MVAAREHLQPPIHVFKRNDVPKVDVSNFIPVTERAHQPSIFSLFDSYHHYAGLRTYLTPEETKQRTFYKLMMDFTSIRQEATGQPQTNDIVTRVTLNQQGKLLFSHPHYFDGSDLAQKYLASTAELTGYQKHRYDLEIKQTILLWQKAAEVLPSLALDQSNLQQLSEQLVELGFSQINFPPTLGLLSVYPQLKDHSHNKTQIPALIGPILLSASPPTPIHYQGESSFIWATRLAFIPEINEFCVIQNGLFSGYKHREINFFLSYPDHKIEPLPTEENIMAFINQLPPEFTAKHSLSIINEIVEKVGYFKPLPKIDKNIRSGEIDFEQYANMVIQLFEWEYQQCSGDPSLLSAMPIRFEEWEKIILHSVVGGFPLDLNGLIQIYKQSYQDVKVAKNPAQHMGKIVQELHTIYSSSSIPLDLRKFECIAGGVLFNKNILTSQIKNLNIGAEKLLLVNQKKGINTQAELEQLCQDFNLPIEWFKPNHEGIRCHMCHQKTTFMGPCGICPICNARYQMAFSSIDQNLPDSGKPEVTQSTLPFRPTVSLTQLINNDIYQVKPLETKTT